MGNNEVPTSCWVVEQGRTGGRVRSVGGLVGKGTACEEDIVIIPWNSRSTGRREMVRKDDHVNHGGEKQGVEGEYVCASVGIKWIVQYFKTAMATSPELTDRCVLCNCIGQTVFQISLVSRSLLNIKG